MNLVDIAQKTVTPEGVVYRIHRQSGTLVVKVFCVDVEPRVTFFIESLHDCYPTVLFLSEVIAFIDDAIGRAT